MLSGIAKESLTGYLSLLKLTEMGCKLTWQDTWNVSYMHCVHFMHPSGKESSENFAKGRTIKKTLSELLTAKGLLLV